MRSDAKLIRTYWQVTRNSTFGLLLVLPLWLLYEVLAFQLNDGWLGELRTGTDLLVKYFLWKLDLNPGIGAVLILVAAAAFVLARREEVRESTRRPSFFGYAILESVVYALLFGVVVGGVLELFLSQGYSARHPRVAALVMNLGAGVYEELFFRLVLISAVVAALGKMTRWPERAQYALAVGLSAVLFASAHHLQVFQEPLNLRAWGFRFLAGVAFALLFIARGVGIAAYTHSLYNVLLMFR